MPGRRGAAPSEARARAETSYVQISKLEGKASRMSAKPPTRQAPQAAPPGPAKRGSLRWVRDVLGRSIRLEQRKNQLHVALVDPRQDDEPIRIKNHADLGPAPQRTHLQLALEFPAPGAGVVATSGSSEIGNVTSWR